MKKRYLIFILILSFSIYVFAQESMEDKLIPKFIMWTETDQREIITTDKDYEFTYHKLDRENHYMKFIPQEGSRDCIIQLKAYPTKAKPRPIMVAQSVYIPQDGSSPISYNHKAEKSDRLINFTYIGQREKVISGEVINITYHGVNTDKIYISYESDDDGYWLELTSLHEMKRLKFERLCQTFVVATPELTTIEYSDDVRYEQIIWTPREDNSWEVRMGAVERGCKSEALQRIQKLRTKEYLENVPGK